MTIINIPVKGYPMFKSVVAGGMVFCAGMSFGLVVGTMYGSALERMPRV